MIISQARVGSSRLPGKVLKRVLDKPLLEFQIERLRRVKLADEVVIATTTKDVDQPIVDLCNRLSVPCFRGSEEDVLARFYGAAKNHRADVIVRVTSDCPIIDPQVLDQVIQYYIDHQSQYDYVSNCLERSYPRGMDAEVFSFTVLAEAFQKATERPEREHVTSFIYRNPQFYRLANVAYVENQSRHRWTVDTVEDFELIKNMIEALYPLNPLFDLKDCLILINNHQEWYNINSYIEQKVYGQ